MSVDFWVAICLDVGSTPTASIGIFLNVLKKRALCQVVLLPIKSIGEKVIL